MAYTRIIAQGEYKITNKHSFDDYKRVLGISDYGDFYSFNKALNRFLNSSLKEFDNDMIKELFECARNKILPYTHSMYLKEYQMLNPEKRGLDKYDFILLDEAQDTNAVTLDIFASNRCKKILVGDTFQNIYGFRETINALEIMNTTYEKNLTYSFRCKQPILSKACYFLKEYGGKNIFFRSAYQEKENESKTSAIITRTNAGIINVIALEFKKMEEALEKGKSVDKLRYKLIKDPESIFMASINCFYLNNGREFDMSKDFKWLAKLSDEELKEVAEKDIEIKNALKIADSYGVKLFSLFELAKKMYKTKEFDTYLTNAHISKGLEWDSVTLYEDFPSLIELEIQALEEKNRIEKEYLIQKLKEETNLYYVALTRAKDKAIDNTENHYEYIKFISELKEKKAKKNEVCEEMLIFRQEAKNFQQDLTQNKESQNADDIEYANNIRRMR